MNCFASSILPMVRGNLLTNERLCSANTAVRSSRSYGFAFSSLEFTGRFGIFDIRIWIFGFRIFTFELMSMSVLARPDRFEFGNCGGMVVAFDQSVTQVDRAPRMARDIGFVRDENNRVPALIETFEERHDFFAGFGIEVAGRFIGQNN